MAAFTQENQNKNTKGLPLWQWCPISNQYVLTGEPMEGEGDGPTEGKGDGPTEGEGDGPTEGEGDGECSHPEPSLLSGDGTSLPGIPTTRTLDTMTIQVDSRQDFATKGVLDNGTVWTVVMDGHGTNKVIDCIRDISPDAWRDIISAEDSTSLLRDRIRSIGNTKGSGATCSIVKISQKGIDCEWVGDSQIRVFHNEEQIFVSQNHSPNNASEMERLARAESLVKTESAYGIKVLSPERLTMQVQAYVCFSTGCPGGAASALAPAHSKRRLDWDKINMTNSLGHNDATGVFTERRHIPVEGGSEHRYRVLTGTDGAGDVLIDPSVRDAGQGPDPDTLFLGDPSTSLKNITDFVLARWAQEWIYAPPQGFKSDESKQRIPLGDDIGVAMWDGHF